MSPFDVSWMVGRSVNVSTPNGHQWFFNLGDTSCISVECPWRLLLNEKIDVSSEDHNQKYGLLAPIDAAAKANKLLSGLSVVGAEIRHGTGDLLVNFEGDIRLEVIPFFRGYEAWQLTTPQGRVLLAGCGGELFAW